MTSIYFDGAVCLKAYSSMSKGGKTTIKIELEAADHFDAASVLRQLDQVEQKQREAAKPRKRTAIAQSTQEDQL